MTPVSDETGSPLAHLWAQLAGDACPVIRETWPAARECAFLAALREDAPDRASDLALAHDFLTGLLRVPVVAVAGLLNAGKSSLVASLLSSTGRPRVLRGVQRSAGTHRFTLWCPAGWESNVDFREALQALLAAVFGGTVEALAIDPAEAHVQQRERGRLTVPLLAFDPALDDHGLCLLDCPDIQRHEAGDRLGIRQRRDVLAAAGKICSAVFVVLPRGELEVEQVSEVLEALPRALRVLLINFCSGESPLAVATEARAAWGDIAPKIYVAYDFRHRNYETATPEWDPNRAIPPEGVTSDAVPCFFAVAEDASANLPRTVDRDRGITAFPRSLAPDRLLQERQRALVEELRRRVVVGGEFLAARVGADEVALRAAADALRHELNRLLDRDGDLRIKLDPALIQDFAAGIRRTAPWDLKPFLWVSQRASAAVAAIRAAVQGVTGGISERIRDEGRRIGAVLADARVDADRIADSLRLWSAARRQARDREFWMPVAERILERFHAQDGGRLPASEWNERARDLWGEVPVWRARAAVLTTVLAAMATVALLSVAGGPILVALGVKSAALTVTVKELLVVIGLGSLAQGEAARRLDEWLRERVGARQRAGLVAIAFDEVGLPRAALPEPPPADAVPVQPRTDGFAVRELGVRQRAWLSANWRRIQRDLDALVG